MSQENGKPIDEKSILDVLISIVKRDEDVAIKLAEQLRQELGAKIIWGEQCKALALTASRLRMAGMVLHDILSSMQMIEQVCVNACVKYTQVGAVPPMTVQMKNPRMGQEAAVSAAIRFGFPQDCVSLDRPDQQPRIVLP